MESVALLVPPGYVEKIQEIIEQEHRLHELVAIHTDSLQASILVGERTLSLLPQWHSGTPPVLFPPVLPFDEKILLGLIFFQLGNWEKAVFYCSAQPPLPGIVMLAYALQSGAMIPEEDIPVAEDRHTARHNAAIAMHYANPDATFEAVTERYEQALQAGASPERLAYTARQYATLLTDAGFYTRASGVVTPFLIPETLPQEATIALKTIIVHNEIKQLSAPYDETWMTALKNDLWECLEYYEAKERDADAAFVLMDAAYVAIIDNSYSEALGYLQRAIRIFEKEELAELAAQAQFQKAKLLYTWGQNGNPQFYRQAMNACQEALKVFTREYAPGIFADIHHQLGVIYSEIPDELKKKSVWAAVSVSSFTEALNYYNKVDFPYEFGVICNNQGNAYTRYPLALHSDNFDKALAWYREALDVRNAAQYPAERAITLLNYVEAAWHLGSEKEFDEALFHDMVSKAREVKTLPVSEELLKEADNHLEQLEKLEAAMKLQANDAIG